MPCALGVANRLTVAVKELTEGGALAVHLVRHDEPEALRRPLQPDCSAVQRLMVEAAQCESVADLVRPSVGVPPDVCGLNEVVVKSEVETAHGAASFVRPKDGMAETRIAGGPCLGPKPFGRPREPDIVADRVVPGGRKVPAEEPSRRLFDQFRIG